MGDGGLMGEHLYRGKGEGGEGGCGMGGGQVLWRGNREVG